MDSSAAVLVKQKCSNEKRPEMGRFVYCYKTLF